MLYIYIPASEQHEHFSVISLSLELCEGRFFHLPQVFCEISLCSLWNLATFPVPLSEILHLLHNIYKGMDLQ